MAEKPVFGLDPGWVRLALEANGIPREEWPDMIRQMQTVHRAREEGRRKNG